MKKIDSNFLSKSTICAGWLYLPDKAKKPPVVIMAHGLASERTFRLPAFAEKFAEKGMAVFIFDYRSFGDSDGKPRNWVSPKRHLQDWEAAVNHVKTLDEVNSDKIGLWGSSFSGGHVLVTAAKTPGISAVVSQVPFVDGISTTMKFDVKFQLTGIFKGLNDFFRMITFREPFYVPVVGDPDTFAVMNTPESKSGFMAIVPDDSKWENRCPARILLTLPMYRPTGYVRRIKCPVLIINGDKDSLITDKAVQKTAKKIKNIKFVTMPVGHFDVYHGDIFEQVVKLEAEFLYDNLLK